MQFSNEKKRKVEFKAKSMGYGLSKQKGMPRIEVKNEKELYEMEVNFYSMPPAGEISLEEAESFVEERLKVLLIFDDSKLPSTASNFQDYKTFIESKINNISVGNDSNFINFFQGSRGLKKAIDAHSYRRRDHISHFLLRLYFCRSEELRRKFIMLESEFLRFRLLTINDNANISNFIKYYHFNFDSVDNIERDALIKAKKLEFMYTPDLTLFKLPFEEALDVIKSRNAYVNDGYAYISATAMISIIVYKFQLELAQALATLFVRLSELNEERRLLPLIDNIYQMSLNKKKIMDAASKRPGYHVTPEMLDDLSKQSFPPCMQHIHETLRSNHHLKHFGRLHYGLFLKSIGLSMEDALKFFREEFINKITPERFQRDYSYNIRYNYGKEGKKVDMSAYSCAKIIGGCAPQSGDTHGCPFRHFDVQNLRNLLTRYDISENEIDEIVGIADDKQYTKACSKYFEAKHKFSLQADEFIYHPNQFYRESRRLLASGSLPIREEIKNDDNECTPNVAEAPMDSTTANSNADELHFEEMIE